LREPNAGLGRKEGIGDFGCRPIGQTHLVAEVGDLSQELGSGIKLGLLAFAHFLHLFLFVGNEKKKRDDARHEK
jgi:hypothetical protein